MQLLLHTLFPILGNSSADINESNAVDDSGNAWFIPQDNPTENSPILINSPKYGFANKVSGALAPFEVCVFVIYSLILNFTISAYDKSFILCFHQINYVVRNNICFVIPCL